VAGGGAAVWSFHAGAQQGKVSRIGVLSLGNPQPNWNLVRDALRERGHVETKNTEFEIRSAEGNPKLLPGLAQELVRLKVDLIVAIFTLPARAAKEATKAIPIVIAPSADPVGTGLVTSLSRPGGNITGMSATAEAAAGKTLELMREIIPSLRRVTVVITREDPLQMRAAGRNLGIEIQPVMLRGTDELEAAFASITRERTDAVMTQPDLGRRAVELAFKNRLPTAAPNSSLADAGCLMTYSGDIADICRKAAGYVDRILKGAKPGDLPIQQPTKFELVINLKTARALGLTVPQSVLLRADKVIE
jgi:putative ABC transport system substrate-binding protein